MCSDIYPNIKHVKAGNMLTLQKDGTAMLLAQAHCRADQALYKLGQKDGISSLKLSLIIPAHYGRSKKVMLGDETVDNFSFRSDRIRPIAIDTGDVYIHIYPLVPTNFERDCAMELVRENAYEAIRLVNYRGPARAFTTAELARMLNGCVVTLRAHADFANLEAFHKEMCEVRIQDHQIDRQWLLRISMQGDSRFSAAQFRVMRRSSRGRHSMSTLMVILGE